MDNNEVLFSLERKLLLHVSSIAGFLPHAGVWVDDFNDGPARESQLPDGRAALDIR